MVPEKISLVRERFQTVLEIFLEKKDSDLKKYLEHKKFESFGSCNNINHFIENLIFIIKENQHIKMCKTKENKIFRCHCGSKNFVQQKHGLILALNQNQKFESKKVIECQTCGLTFVQKLEGRFSAVECNICGSIFFFPKLNENVSAVPEKIPAVSEKISVVPRKILTVSEKITAVPEKGDAILMKNLSCWNCGSTSKRVFDIKKTFECKNCHSTLFFSRSPETWTRVKI